MFSKSRFASSRILFSVYIPMLFPSRSAAFVTEERSFRPERSFWKPSTTTRRKSWITSSFVTCSKSARSDTTFAATSA